MSHYEVSLQLSHTFDGFLSQKIARIFCRGMHWRIIFWKKQEIPWKKNRTTTKVNYVKKLSVFNFEHRKTLTLIRKDSCFCFVLQILAVFMTNFCCTDYSVKQCSLLLYSAKLSSCYHCCSQLLFLAVHWLRLL